MAEFASKGTTGTALGFGIGGTVLGLLNGGLGNILGGNGNNSSCCGHNAGSSWGNNNSSCCFETKEASCLRSENATLRAEKYTDAASISTYREAVEMDKKQSENIRTLLVATAQQDKDIAVLKANIECLAADTNSKLALTAQNFNGKLELESERRACGDDRIVSWTEGNFIRGRLVLPSTPTITGFNNGCCCQDGPVSAAA